MYILVHEKRERSKTNLPNLLKRHRTEAVKKKIEPLYITVAKSSKCNSKKILKLAHRILSIGDLELENIKNLALHAMASLILLRFARCNGLVFTYFKGSWNCVI